MLTYECDATLLPDGHLDIPEYIKLKINNHGIIKISISIDEEIDEKLAALSLIKGLLNDKKDSQKFDDTLHNRFNLSKRDIDL